MARNVLNLELLTDRATVTISGTPYDLVNAAELSVVDYQRVSKWGRRVQELMDGAEDLSDEQVDEMRSLLDRLCRLILRAPAEIHEKLNVNQRLAVTHAFTGLLRGTIPVPAEASDAPVTAEAPVAEPLVLAHDAPERSTGVNT